MKTKAELIADLDRARETMRQLLHDLEAKHQENMELYPTWTVKELLSHITGWDDASIDSLHAHIVGTVPLTPAAKGVDPYNASTVNERKDLSLQQVIDEWEGTRITLKETLLAVSDALMAKSLVYSWGESGSVEEMITVFVDHEEEHAREIRSLVTNKD